MSNDNMRERIGKMDSYFRIMNIKEHDIKEEGHVAAPVPSKNFNSRGEEMLTPKQVRDNYEKALPCFKWYQIPLCRKSIKRKINFWAPASVVLAWTYGEYAKKQDSNNIIKSLPFKFYMKSFVFFFAVTTAYCFAESLYSDEFCDIESPFYQETESRLSMARRIKS